jgi:signal transduction histidine kinase
MWPKSLIKGFDKGRLQGLIALFFLALAVPTGVLIWQAYSQLKWEAFHQYRGIAEGLATRIDSDLMAKLEMAEARSFADYTFLVVAGDQKLSFVQRSPLSDFPVSQDMHGVIGYFQVGAEGEFSTPLLPQDDADPATFGVSAEEFDLRIKVAQKIREILSENQLVPRQQIGMRRGLASVPAAPADGPSVLAGTEEEADGAEERQRRLPASASFELSDGTVVGDKDAVDRLSAAPEEAKPRQNEVYSQAVFDALNAPKKSVDDQYRAGGLVGETIGGTLESKERVNALGKVADLKLDANLQRKSELAEKARDDDAFRDEEQPPAPGRMKRREQIALPESEPPRPALTAARAPMSYLSRPNIRISTFESEVDPLEFSQLDSGHFVLFRKVWREGERYIQGILLSPGAFAAGVVDTGFYETGLSAMSNLIVAYRDDIIFTLHGNRYPDYTAESFDGALLYRSRMSAPFDGLELIFSINGLPAGPGASVLGWVTLVLAIVFVGGFYTLYRLGISQINLARQQQDFVSAVSHELKTPLTSIRMYGEMLREGWAEPAKRQQYYEFIHDESERLSRLITNVLQLAKITRNEPQFDLHDVTVSELMNQIESKISSQVQRAGFELDIQKDGKADNLTINIDADCFAQIIINLVDNAIKFSRDAETKRIEISSRPGGDDKVLFAVRDFGPGVPKNQMKKIFQLFYRSESELTRETVGTGIGLAIVHQLSHAMSGKVDVLNKEPGAEFRVVFPTITPIN